MIIRGNTDSVAIDLGKARELNDLGYRWSGHTHPGVAVNVLQASEGDYEVLKQFKQLHSVIYDSTGRFMMFERGEPYEQSNK